MFLFIKFHLFFLFLCIMNVFWFLLLCTFALPLQPIKSEVLFWPLCMFRQQIVRWINRSDRGHVGTTAWPMVSHLITFFSSTLTSVNIAFFVCYILLKLLLSLVKTLQDDIIQLRLKFFLNQGSEKKECHIQRPKNLIWTAFCCWSLSKQPFP